MRKLLTVFLAAFAMTSTAQTSTKPTSGNRLVFPSFTLQNPLNTGQLGTVVASGVLQHRTRLGPKADGNVDVYLGLGKPATAIGGGVTFNLYGLTNNLGEQNNFGQGAINLHLSRFLFGQQLLLDAGVDNAAVWGLNKALPTYISYKRSFYLVGNYLFRGNKGSVTQPFSYLSLTAGVGNGTYASDETARLRREGFAPLLSLATPLYNGINLIGEWNGYDLGLGLAAIPVQRFPLQARAEITDIVYGKPRLVASLSMPLFLSKDAKPTTDRPIGLRSIRPARTI